MEARSLSARWLPARSELAGTAVSARGARIAVGIGASHHQTGQRIYTLPATGGRRPVIDLLARAPGPILDSDAALLPQGGVAITQLRAAAATAPGRTPLRLRTADATGVVTTDAPLDLPGEKATWTVAGGPTGAAAAVVMVWSDDELATDGEPSKGGQQWLAFKPAGASRFVEPVAVDGPQMDGEIFPELGPDGGGVLLSDTVGQAPPALRRIAPDGTVGPVIPLPFSSGSSFVGGSTFAPDGTYALTVRVDPPDDPADAATSRAPGTYLVRLLPGATEPLVSLVPGTATYDGDAAVALGPDDTAMLVIARGLSGLVGFAGPPAALKRTARLPATNDPPAILRRPAGDWVLVWDVLPWNLGSAHVLAAHCTAAGRCGQPVHLTLRRRDVSLAGAGLDARGRLLVVTQTGTRTRTRLDLARVAPWW